MEDRIATIIRDWLSTTFGNQDAIPNLMVKGLAEEIDKHRWEIYSYTKDEYDMEDIDMVAENNGIELTKEEREHAYHRYRKAQEYESSMDTLYEIIEEIENERKNK